MRTAIRTPSRSTSPPPRSSTSPSSGTNAGATQTAGPPPFFVPPSPMNPSNWSAPLRTSRSRARVMAT